MPCPYMLLKFDEKPMQLNSGVHSGEAIVGSFSHNILDMTYH